MVETAPGTTRKDAIASACLFLALLAIYTANGRAIGAGDVVPATFLPTALARGDGPYLDRFAHLVRTPEGRMPGYADDRRGHAVSRYPIGPALIAAPFELPQVLALDLTAPGWERDTARLDRRLSWMGKNAAAAIAAGAAALLFLVLRRQGRMALPATLIVALGSDWWAVSSQALWQHGPATLCLTAAMFLLGRPSARRLALNPIHPPQPPLTKGGSKRGAGATGLPFSFPPFKGGIQGGSSESISPDPWPRSTRARMALGGLATAMLVVCRPIDLVFSVAILFWVRRHHSLRERAWFLAPAAAVAIALCGYNLWFFGKLSGGYAAIEAMHPWAHGTKGTWTAPFLEGAIGTLASPSHGLFVYCPWVLLAVVALPEAWARLGRGSLDRCLVLSLVPYFVLLAKYSCWWGGHSYGPRFWIDAMPIVALVLARSLDRVRVDRRWAAVLGLSVAWSFGLQGIAALCYPSSWYGAPRNADRHHERLWDWRDTEVSRCLKEGPRPRTW